MITARGLAPKARLAPSRWWHTTTIHEGLEGADANTDDRYAALDWCGTAALKEKSRHNPNINNRASEE